MNATIPPPPSVRRIPPVPPAKPRELFERKPRWPGAPKICLATNLPAFETPEALARFQTVNCPTFSVVKKWQCIACKHWHAWSVGGDPAGASSGTTRSAKSKDHILERLMRSPLAKTIPQEAGE